MLSTRALVQFLASFFIVGWLAICATSAFAQPAPGRMPGYDPEPNPNNSPIEIVYATPMDAKHRPIYDRLKGRRVLEELREFLSPLKLPQRLTIEIAGCNGEVNSWYRQSKVTLCYEYIAHIEDVAARGNPPPGLPGSDVVVGPFLQVALHELSHAIFDILDVPLLGRQEDAADALAQYVLLSFGPQVARRTLVGVAFFYGVKSQGQTLSGEDFSDEHGTDGQRFYNALCIAYGSDPANFRDFAERNLLPARRKGRCGEEYQHMAKAFRKLIMPFVDQEAMQRVRAKEWLRPDDGRLDPGGGPANPNPPSGPTNPGNRPPGSPVPGQPPGGPGRVP